MLLYILVCASQSPKIYWENGTFSRLKSRFVVFVSLRLVVYVRWYYSAAAEVVPEVIHEVVTILACRASSDDQVQVPCEWAADRSLTNSEASTSSLLLVQVLFPSHLPGFCALRQAHWM